MKFLIYFILVAAIATFTVAQDDEPSQQVVTNSEACKMCIRFITKMSKQILAHAGDMKKYGHKVCDILTWGKEDLDKRCRTLVDDKIDYICEKVRASKTSEEICMDIHFC